VDVHAAVIIAHPANDSFTQAIACRVVDGLRAADHTVDVLDLYALNFAPAMSEAEREAYHSDEPILDPIVAEHAAIAQQVDTLVFVYPTWWGGLPAILKGWLDRVLVPGVGFVIDERTEKVKPGLTNVRKIVGVSTYGSSRTRVRLVHDNGRRTLSRALRVTCGLRTRVKWHGLYGLDTSTQQQREDFAASVERAMTVLR
jgi:putative NADPH-quinone reductase